MYAISTCNGLQMPLAKRFSLYKTHGFDSVLLWWGNGETESRCERVRLAAADGLQIEHAHGAFDQINAIWTDGSLGDAILREKMAELYDCANSGIGTLVLHLSSSSQPPPVSPIGIARIEYLLQMAEQCKVRLAFENVRVQDHTRFVLDHYNSKKRFSRRSFHRSGICFFEAISGRWS